MRTLTPTSVRDDFLSAVGDVETTFGAAEASVIPVGGKKLIAEYSFLAAAILLEGYISDLFIAYINRDSSRFRGYLLPKMTIEATDPHAKSAKDFAEIVIKPHLVADEIRAVLDSRDFNITFPTVADMKAKAGQWLADPHKGYFTGLSAAQGATLTACKAIRNFLAQRSKSAKTTMQNELVTADLPSSLRRGQHMIKDVGSFLRSHPTPQEDLRFTQYLTAIKALGSHLCP